MRVEAAFRKRSVVTDGNCPRYRRTKERDMKHISGSILLLRHPERLGNHWLVYRNADRKDHHVVMAERLNGKLSRDFSIKQLPEWSIFAAAKITRSPVWGDYIRGGPIESKKNVSEAVPVNPRFIELLDQAEASPGIRGDEQLAAGREPRA